MKYCENLNSQFRINTDKGELGMLYQQLDISLNSTQCINKKKKNLNGRMETKEKLLTKKKKKIHVGIKNPSSKNNY